MLLYSVYMHVYSIPPVRGLSMLWVSYDPQKDWLCLRVLLGKLYHFFRQGHERALLGARLETLLQRMLREAELDYSWSTYIKLPKLVRIRI